jgi:transposase-like protein
MQIPSLPPMRPELVVCPNPACDASGRIGVHSYQERRYLCHACDKTFAETSGTPLYDLKHPIWLVVVVLALLACGCPVPAIVFAFGLSERTVTDWQVKAGRHAHQVQEQEVCQGQVEIGQVHGDELYVKTQYGTVWMATAMRVFSRLWLWGAIAPTRDTALITQVVQQVRAAGRTPRQDGDVSATLRAALTLLAEGIDATNWLRIGQGLDLIQRGEVRVRAAPPVAPGISVGVFDPPAGARFQRLLEQARCTN